MSILPAWATDPGALLITEAGYDALPEDVQRQIEVVDGHVIFCRSGSFQHNNVARRLANALEQARPAEPCTGVVTDFEMHYVKGRPGSPGFSFRRPDVVLHRCVEEDRKLTTADALLVVEVVSPGSEYTDTVDKRAEYAHEGIPIYLVVHLDAERRVKIVQEYRLDCASRTYRLAETHQDALRLTGPFPMEVAFKELDGS
ncbi:Endonuclease, Uma2 family (restriction endonuclease fold) [Nocardia amikacinitolerans]|uniref:Uma2 family endonuclease n=1 Tax=Nocardia amikacinitolerans TaxID=756689 RepID=UPI0008369337|nr:Uma2 family endonuclease [Nocardia amikacinitolerans]MCP2320247.1 Endonuclease, Uma2 family (restriction endonuclease fold) [Nocardia amikacinitolerans]